MKRVMLSLLICALATAPTMAVPSLGWWEEYAPQSTHQFWDFTPQSHVPNSRQFNAESIYNPGVAIAQQILGTWDEVSNIYGTQIIVGDLKIDNWRDEEPYKEIWVDLGLTGGTVDFVNSSVVASGSRSPYKYVTIQQSAPNAEGISFGFRIYPNPDWEDIALVVNADFGATAYLDWVHVDTISIPAPGTILLGSIGTGLVGWLRRRRAI